MGIEFVHFVSYHLAYYPNPYSNPNPKPDPNPNPNPKLGGLFFFTKCGNSIYLASILSPYEVSEI